jgi:Cu-processing system permease protein
MLVIARKELADGLRNRWVWIVSAALAGAVLTIAFFGSAPVGVAGVQTSGALLASVMNLVVYLVPLLAMVLGCGAIIDEKQRGTLDLILLSAVTPLAYVTGTFAGFAAALAVAVATGLGLASIVLVSSYGLDATECFTLIALAVMLGSVFLAIAFLVSLLARERGRAIVCSVFVWLLAVLVFDLLLVGVLVASDGKVPQWLFSALLLANPTDLFRMVCFHRLGTAAGALGLATIKAFLPSMAVLGAFSLAWIIVPLAMTHGLFKRRVRMDSLTR